MTIAELNEGRATCTVAEIAVCLEILTDVLGFERPGEMRGGRGRGRAGRPVSEGDL